MAMTSASSLQSRSLHNFTLPCGGWPATTQTPSFSYALKEKEEKDIIVNKDDSVSKEIIAATTKKPEAEKKKKKKKKKKQQVVMEMGLTKEEEENDMIEVMKGKRLPKKKERKSTKDTSQYDYFLARLAGYGFRVTFTTS